MTRRVAPAEAGVVLVQLDLREARLECGVQLTLQRASVILILNAIIRSRGFGYFLVFTKFSVAPGDTLSP
jgi:hypothetical protein